MRLRLELGVLDLDEARLGDVTFPGVQGRLLRYLAEQGRPVGQEELLEQVWGYAPTAQTRTVRVTIGRIRKKLERDPSNPRHLRTEHGLGYRLVAAPDQGDLIGREADRVRILEAGRVVTITGEGGVGKTSLARRCCEELGGVWVDCAEATTSDALLRAVATELALGMSTTLAGDVATLQPPLLFLDNLEQVDDPSLLDRWTAGRIVSTSRLPLEIADEEIIHLEPLGGADAGRLMAARWRSGGGGDLSDDEAEAIAAQVGGVPLAIELAASWAGLLNRKQLLERLERGTGWLEDAARPVGQRSLAAVLGVSWTLLEPEEQDIVSQLAVFAGPIRIEDAEAVLRPRDRALPGLRRARLLGFARGTGQLIVPRPVHEFLLERCPEDAWVRHAEHFGARACSLPGPGPEFGDTLAALEGMRLSLLSAWTRSTGDLRLALAASLHPLLLHRGPPELAEEVAREAGGRHHADALLLLGRNTESLEVARLARAAMPMARALDRLARNDDALEVLDAAPAIDPLDEPAAFRVRARVAQRQSRTDEAVALARRSVVLAEPLGDTLTLARSLGSLAQQLAFAGQSDEADRVSRRAVELESGDCTMVETWVIRGRILDALGRPSEGAAAYQRGLELAAGVRQRGILRLGLGTSHLGAGRDKEALVALQRAAWLASRHPDILASVHCVLAVAHAAAGHCSEAVGQVEAALAATESAYQLAWHKVIVGMGQRLAGVDPVPLWEEARTFFKEHSVEPSLHFADLLLASEDPARPLPDCADHSDVELRAIHAALMARRAGRPAPEDTHRSYRVRFALAGAD